MKKQNTATLLCLLLGVGCLMSCVTLTGCTKKNTYFLPQVAFTAESAAAGFTIEHVTNIEKDYELPDGEKLTHSDYTKRKNVQWAWLIRHNGDVAGWIITTGGCATEKGKTPQYGFTASTTNGTYGFQTEYIKISLLDAPTSIFESNVVITANFGGISKQSTETLKNSDGEEIGAAAHYQYDLTSANPAQVDTIKITLDFVD